MAGAVGVRVRVMVSALRAWMVSVIVEGVFDGAGLLGLSLVECDDVGDVVHVDLGEV